MTPEKTIKNLAKTAFKKGCTPWNKGKKTEINNGSFREELRRVIQ